MSSRYGKLVRAWDWRTTPERLARMDRSADVLKITKTQLLELCADLAINLRKHGAVQHGGVTLVLWSQAELSGNHLADNLRADNYFEWSAPAFDAWGKAYIVSWLHQDDGREPDQYDWSAPDNVQRDYDHDISES